MNRRREPPAGTTDAVVAEGLGFVEGPVVHGARVIVTSIDTGAIWSHSEGAVERVASLGGGPNGACLGGDGLLYVAQNGGKWPGVPTPGVTGGVQVIDLTTGEVRWLTQDPISPNDVCFGPDGFLYVTDPTRSTERDDGRLWRCDVGTGECELLGSVPWYPNGIGFGLEPDALYVASTGEQRILRYRFDGGRLRDPETVVQMSDGHPDGFAFDADGNIYVGAVSFGEAPGTVQVWDPDGRLLDTWSPGDGRFYTNVAFGPDGRLFVCHSDGGRVIVTSRWQGVEALALHPLRAPS